MPVLGVRSCATGLCLTLAATAAIAQSTNDTTETIIVTGTRLPSGPEQSAVEVRIYDRARIEASGQTTIADFLATVPEVSIASLESSTISTTVRLRGAIFGSTLILINGRRTQSVTGSSATSGFFDLNTIPLSMVERIDVLPNGSSAIYGGEALAGVINIVLKSDFQGTELDLGYKDAKDTHETTFSAGAGWGGDSTHFSIIGSYSDRDALSGADREITASADYRRFGGPNLGSPFFGAPATIFSIAGNLPGLNSSFAAVPSGSPGVGLRPSDFAATAGQQNTGGYTSYQDLVPYSVRSGLFFTGDARLRSGVELFSELLATEYTSDGVFTPPALLLANVPATNAFNPFGTAVRASGLVLGAERLATYHQHDDFLRPVVGARGRFGDWDWETSAVWARDDGQQTFSGQTNSALLNAALASSDPRTALNPFVDGPMTSPATLASIFSAARVADWTAAATVVNGFVRGAPLQLAAGPLDTVFGAEYESDRLQRGMDADRSVKAAFTELHAPLVAAGGAGNTKRELFALQAAVRYDDYSDFGSNTSWQAGIELRPAASVLLRATNGTAFKPPTLYNLAAPRLVGNAPVVDPLRQGETVVVQGTTGGNPNLDPTTSRASTLGVLWSRPDARLDVSLTAWRLRIDSAINFPSPQYIINNESLYPGRVTRAPPAAGQPGQIVSVNYSYVNFGDMSQDGIDANARWSVSTAIGEFTPAIAATYMTKFDGASTPGGAEVDRLSRANTDGIFAPRLKGTAGVAWSPNQKFKVSLAGRYVGQYYDYTPPRTLGDVWYLDSSLQVAFGKTVSVLLTGTNLTDKLPPYSTYFRGYDVFNYDLVGRTIFGRVQVRF